MLCELFIELLHICPYVHPSHPDKEEAFQLGWNNLELAFSPGTQRHFFHISSTKGLGPGMYASMIGDHKKAIFKFYNSVQQPGGATKDPPNVTLKSQFEYIHET